MSPIAINRAQQEADQATLRAYIAANPGKTRDEIREATGLHLHLTTLLVYGDIRQDDCNPPRWFVKEKGGAE